MKNTSLLGSVLLAATLGCSGKSESTTAAGGAAAATAGQATAAQATAGQATGGAAAATAGQATGGAGVAPTGGAAPTAGATGGAVTGGGGQTTGGDGGAPPARQVTCWSLTGSPDLPPSPFERIEVTGTNGTFIDACDAEGNVVEYHCPMRQVCGGEFDCAPFPTGEAGPMTVPCEAGCADGVCLQ